jgi:hypothetical protein
MLQPLGRREVNYIPEVPRRFKVDWDLLLDGEVHEAAAYWYSQCSWTRDEAAPGETSKSRVVKRFPWEKREDIQRVVNYMLDDDGLFLILGSRKILKTWTIANFFAFWGLRNEHRNIFIGSTKEDRADLNLQRIIQIIATLRQLDTSEKQPPCIHMVARPPYEFHIGNGTVYSCLTLNITDLVQVTSSATWMDEVTKLPESYKEKFISEGLPATQVAVGDEGVANTKFVMSGTCNGEERVYRMMFNDEQARGMQVSPYEDQHNEYGLRCPENGLKMWNDEKFHRILWYYFADPGKCPGTPWNNAERAKWKSNEEGWNREMEVWPLKESKRRITPEYHDKLHRRSFDELKSYYCAGVPLVIGWDIGGRFQAATVTQCNPATGQVLVFFQHFEDNRDLHSFGMRVIEIVKTDFPEATAYHIGDPRTLATSTMTAQGTAAEYLENVGISIAPAPAVNIATKITLVKRCLMAVTVAHEPMLLIAGDRCREIIRGFRGEWEYDATGTKPRKTGYVEHAIDSLCFCLLQHKHLGEPTDADRLCGVGLAYDSDGYTNGERDEGRHYSPSM